MTYEELIEEFAAKLGNGIDLTPDASGAVTLDVDGMPLTILNLPEVDLIALTAPVGEPPPADRMELLYKTMLEANHNFSGTAGATLSINPESGEVALCRTISTQLTDADGFFAVVEGFINTLETWRKLVSDYRGADLSESAAKPAENSEASSFGDFMQV